jgi:hypothetical protein
VTMQSVVIRDARPSDFETICALNLVEVQHTSLMDAKGQGVLADLSCYRKVASVNGGVEWFLPLHWAI